MPDATQLTLPGEPDLTVAVRHSARARRISLRVSRLDGSVTLTLPHGASARTGAAFVAERADWLRQALAGIPQTVSVAPGCRLPVEGRALTLRQGDGRSVRIEGESLVLPARGRPGALAAGWLRIQARERILPAIARHTASLGPAARRPPGRLRLADPRGRWGSCAASGDLMLSWRLILAPPAVLDYVVAHEVAHLAQMNHSPAFWAEVARLLPDFAHPRAWLKRHGAELHRYRFDG